MNRIKLFVMAAALVACASASAQFSNTSGGVNKQRTSARQTDFNGIQSGYNGFFEMGYTIGVGDGEGANRLALSTTHGYQINPYIFAGVGFGVNYFHESGYWNIPIFADVRVNLNARISPFVDMRIGYSMIDFDGLYFNPSVGVRIGKNNSALIASIGYEMQKYEFEYSDSYFSYHDTYNIGGITLRIGWEF